MRGVLLILPLSVTKQDGKVAFNPFLRRTGVQYGPVTFRAWVSINLFRNLEITPVRLQEGKPPPWLLADHLATCTINGTCEATGVMQHRQMNPQRLSSPKLNRACCLLPHFLLIRKPNIIPRKWNIWYWQVEKPAYRFPPFFHVPFQEFSTLPQFPHGVIVLSEVLSAVIGEVVAPTECVVLGG